MSTCVDHNVTCLFERLAFLESSISTTNLTASERTIVQDMARTSNALDTAWVLVCGMLVFLMQLGFAMLESGSVREHSVIATYMKNLLDLALGTLAGTL